MKKCVSGKRVYVTEEIAVEALIGAHTTYSFKSGQGPIAVYVCEDCGCYHLSSQGTMNEKLEQHLAGGKISAQKEANHWLGKIKKR